jgi:hypothetical protein
MQVYPEGTHIMIPWFERPVIYDVRARPHLVESTSGSRDLQMVNCFVCPVSFLLTSKILPCSVVCLSMSLQGVQQFYFSILL